MAEVRSGASMLPMMSLSMGLLSPEEMQTVEPGSKCETLVLLSSTVYFRATQPTTAAVLVAGMNPSPPLQTASLLEMQRQRAAAAGSFYPILLLTLPTVLFVTIVPLAAVELSAQIALHQPSMLALS